MSREYAESRIREALKLSRGNSTKARQQIIAWAATDAKLLLALAGPHLTGIVAHAIGRVIHQQEHEEQGDHEEEIAEPQQELPPVSAESFGQSIMSALRSGSSAVFGQDSGAPPLRRKQASQSHIEALRLIASKKKKDGK